jgi:CHAT domain-containing protein
VVSDGPLLAVPFSALEAELGRSGVVSEREPITVLDEPSAAVFSWLSARPLKARTVKVAIFGDARSESPAHSERIEPGSAESMQKSLGDVAELPFAAREAAMIRSVLGPSSTEVFTGSAASPTALRSFDWSAFSIGHFATHAVLDQQYAELNGLVLGREDEPILWYGDVCRMRTHLELVVLSACNTALGENTPGEGLQGLTQAFFVAGSQRVLGTLWEVDDEATSEWMRYFYRALRTTRSPARAVAIAQRDMASSPRWQDPYYWAGFTLAGDWRPLP